MKKIIFCLAILLFIILTACDQSNGEQSVARYYHPQTFHTGLDIDNYSWVNFFIYQQRLHLNLLNRDEATGNTYFVLFSMDTDGTNQQEIFRTLLDEAVDFFAVLGFEMHEDGYISLLMQDSIVLPPYSREDVLQGVWPFETSRTFVYRRISSEGEIVSAFGINALNEDDRDISISDAIFDLDENLIINASWLPVMLDLPPDTLVIPEGVGGNSFFFFDHGLNYGFREVEDESLAQRFARTHNGQVIATFGIMSFGAEFPLFYEIDFENTGMLDGPISPIDELSGVFPAPSSSAFDFYLISQARIFGYHESSETYTKLVDMGEFGIGHDIGRNKNDILFWDDGRITVIESNQTGSLARDDFTLLILTPSDNPWVVEREIITLGGVDVNVSPLRAQAAAFNRQSLTHRIEIVNYTVDDMDRLLTELITGRGPDIIKLSWWGADFVANLSESNFLLDLYPMIDADPVLYRDDFFPSVLSTWENSRGDLVKIAPDFSIQTTIGMSAEFPNAPTDWTYADFIDFYQDARAAGFPYPLGQTLDRMHALDKLIFTDETFFSQRNATANFDSDSFITVLEFIMSIPADQGWDRISDLALTGQWDPVGNLLNGEQLLLPFANINNLMHFRALQSRLGGITAFGFPATNTPVHAAQVPSGLAVGIRANSPHADAAWEFVRTNMLSGALGDGNAFPIRLDMFEQLVSDEISRQESATMQLGANVVEMPPMTETDAALLRELIANIGHAPINEHPIQNILYEDVMRFFAGLRSAEDTARIIQSRAQTMLAERAG